MAKSQITTKTGSYRKAVVMFVDILGFRNIVASKSLNEIKNILILHKLLSPTFCAPGVVNSRSIENDVSGYSYQFSDSLIHAIIGNFATDTTMYTRLFSLLWHVGTAQFNLACNGVFVRGGISYGNVYCDQNIIFGQSLIDAYDIERGISNWPVIAIDENLIRVISKYKERYVNSRIEEDKVNGCFLANDVIRVLNDTMTIMDDVYFVDYLNCAYMDDVTTGDMDYKLVDHKESIVAAHKKYPNYKYLLLAEYHNKKVRTKFPNTAIDLL